MEQVTFDDVAVYFNEEEWETLPPAHRALYKEVMSDNYQMILSLNRPDIITNIELGYEPYITSTPDFRHPESSGSTAQQENSHDTREESIMGCGGLVKRQRRYPRVNPFRWLRKYKKSKSRSSRIGKQPERAQSNLLTGQESTAHPRGVERANATQVTGDGADELSEMPLRGPVDGMEASGETTEEGSRPAEGVPQAEAVTQTAEQGTPSGCIDTQNRHEFEKSLNTADPNPSVNEARGDEEAGHLSQDRTYTKSPDPEQASVKTGPSHKAANQRDARRNSNAADAPANAARVLKEGQSFAHPNRGKTGKDSLASPQRKEKHVKFSDTITTFVFEPQAKECFAEGIADGIKLRSRSPNKMNVSPRAGPSPEAMLVHGAPTEETSRTVKDQSRSLPRLNKMNVSPKAGPSPEATLVHGASTEETSRTVKDQSSRSPPRLNKMNVSPKAGPSPEVKLVQEGPAMEANRTVKDPSNRSPPRLNKMNVGPKASPSPEPKLVHDGPAKETNRTVKDQSSISPPRLNKMNVIPKTSPSLEPKLHRGVQAEETSRTVKDQDLVSDANWQGEKRVTTSRKSEEGSRDRRLPNKKVKKVEAAEDLPQKSEAAAKSSSKKPPSQTPLCPSTVKKDAGTQVEVFVAEEKHQPLPTDTRVPPDTDQAHVKSYNCSNCGKTTHWSKLGDLQKANVQNSVPYVCKMCSRQKDKIKAAESPGKVPDTHASPVAKLAKVAKPTANPDQVNGTQSSPKCVKSGKVTAGLDKEEVEQNSPPPKPPKPAKAVAPSPSRKTPYCKLPEENADSSPAAKKQKPDKDFNWEELSKRLKSSPSHESHTRERANVQDKAASELQSARTKKHSLCRACAHCSSDNPKPQEKSTGDVTLPANQISSPNPKSQLKLRSVNGKPTDQISSPDSKPQQQLRAVNETLANQTSSPDAKRNAPERRKAIRVLQNGMKDDSEQSPASKSPKSGAESVKIREVCSNCGKCFTVKRKLKPLTSVQQAKPAKGGSTLPPDKARKPGADADSLSNDLTKQSPKEKKAKKREIKDPKTPGPPKVAKSQLCTKCGKRLVLHVAPSEDGEGGNENECVVLPRKKRKRPLAGMEPFECKECGKIFTRHFSLMQHRFIHTGERPYACKVCGKSFRDSGYLTVHMRSHTKEKPYSCTECGKSFTQHSALVVHQRTHTDERPFQCKDCGKSFTDRSTFRHHQRIHTGEKPYACSYCGKKFTQQPHMKRHESIHTGDRPFQCVHCGKRFIDRTKLKKHELIHTRWED